MKNLADEMFTPDQRTMQGICALTFWINRVASAATDIVVGDSLGPNPVGELDVALERLRDCASDWLERIRKG